MSDFKQLPNVNDHEDMQKYFLEEIQEGEEALAMGKYKFNIVCYSIYCYSGFLIFINT